MPALRSAAGEDAAAMAPGGVATALANGLLTTRPEPVSGSSVGRTASTCQIRVIDPGSVATALLDCLRSKAKPFEVDIKGYETNAFLADDITDRDDLPQFLSAQLDECGREHELEWRLFLNVFQP
jgi:hypothetical protein